MGLSQITTLASGEPLALGEIERAHVEAVAAEHVGETREAVAFVVIDVGLAVPGDEVNLGFLGLEDREQIAGECVLDLVLLDAAGLVGAAEHRAAHAGIDLQHVAEVDRPDAIAERHDQLIAVRALLELQLADLLLASATSLYSWNRVRTILPFAAATCASTVWFTRSSPRASRSVCGERNDASSITWSAPVGPLPSFAERPPNNPRVLSESVFDPTEVQSHVPRKRDCLAK